MKLFVNVIWSGEKVRKITINNRLAISGNNNRQNVKEEKSEWLPKNCLLAILCCIPIFTLFDDFIFVCSAYKHFVIPMWYIYDDKKITKQKFDSMFYIYVWLFCFSRKNGTHILIYLYNMRQRKEEREQFHNHLICQQINAFIYIYVGLLYSLMSMRSILWWFLINLIISYCDYNMHEFILKLK